MSEIRENINNELESVKFDVSADTIQKKANMQKRRCNTAIITIICIVAVSAILHSGVVNDKSNIAVKEPITQATTQTTTPSEKTNIEKNTFTITACAIEPKYTSNEENGIEQYITNAEKAEITENTAVRVMNHRITIEDMVNNGKTYHIFHIGKSVQEKIDERHYTGYTTQPIIYVTGDNIKSVNFSADIVTLDNRKTPDVNYFFEQATHSNDDEKEEKYTPIYYTRVLLPEKFNDLCIKCNETDYEFKFSDIPVVNITVKITFKNGELQEKRVQVYYDDEGYFTVKG